MDDISRVEEAFVEACPSFRGRRDEMRRDWGDGEPSLFNILHELGWHLAQRIADGEAGEAKRVLLVVEETLRSGSETAIHASTIGLLESLQNSLKDIGFDPNDLTKHLGPATWAWWNDLRQNWAGYPD